MCRTVQNIFLHVINSYVDRTIFLLTILYSTYNLGPKFQNAITKKISDVYICSWCFSNVSNLTAVI
jgi:hypothetical protein